MNVDGKVAVITGAAGGIGAALAERLITRGARVVLTDRSPDVDDRAGQLGDESTVASLTGDASSREHLESAIRLAEQRFGPVDLFFANAGVAGGGGLEATEEQWQQALDVNVLGHVRAAQLLVPGWVERGSGYFVSTASAAGLLTQIGSATYSVTKHGAVAFSEWLSVTYGDEGVRVSCLCPMGVNTAMLTGGTDTPSLLEQRAAAAVTGAGEVLEPATVADAVLETMAEETFLVLPHPKVLDFWRRKSLDYDRWLAGMRRYQASLG